MTASAPQPSPVRRERRIIERPRLIKLLDETEARTILLLAPAGYGKTTLARQWAKTLQSVVWVSLTPRHHDVAWLAADIAEAIDREGGGDSASRTIAEHLSARGNPQRAARQLGVALADQLNAAGIQWLVLDDYHEIRAAPEPEGLVEAIDEHTTLRMIVASRARPSWASSKRVMYGDLIEVNKQQLAMTGEESAEVLERSTAVERLARLARGWPALVALAAQARIADIPDVVLPEALHRYLADELFQRASTELQQNLTTLALLGDLSTGALDARFGAEADRIVREANDLGFNSGQEIFELHPLLREFLIEKLAGDPDRDGRVRQALAANLAAESWDRALELIRRFNLDDSVETALALAFKPLARSGRLETLSTFAATVSQSNGFPAPSVLVVLSEIALRDGRLELARDLAEQARHALSRDHPLHSRAAAIAGQVHLFTAQFEAAEAAFGAARESAQDDRDEAEALHGLTVTMGLGERPGATASVAALERRCDRSPVDFIRFVNAHLHHARISAPEGLNQPLHLEAARQALPHVDDPRARTSLTYQAAYCLALQAAYAEAERWLDLFWEDAVRFDLEFTLPFGYWSKALIALGQRRFADAGRALQSVEDGAFEKQDPRHELNARMLRARLLLQGGDAASAIDCLRIEPDIALIPSWRGEYFATRALVLACSGEITDAAEEAARAERASSASEVRLLIQTARAIAAPDSESDEIGRLLGLARRCAMWDAVVCGVRSSSRLADTLAANPDWRAELALLYRRTGDIALARRAGLRTRSTAEPGEVLSPRELDVLHLIALGYRNREIAQALFIADSTTKVHVRHIFEKLGVRTRSEAVSRYQMFANELTRRSPP